MLITPSTCPICDNAIGDRDTRCLHCRCVVQFTLDPPIFTRTEIVESLVQPTIDRCRAQIGTNPQDGIARYRLGLCYLNYTLLDQGLDELRQAAALLPERHIIRFELALIQSTPGKYAAGLDQIEQAVALAPASRDYRYLQHYLTGMTAQARWELRPAMTSLIAAYERAPDLRLAADALAQFIAGHAAKLTQPIGRSLAGLDPHDRAALQVLNSDPSAQQQKLPRAPKTPGELGKVSMSLLHKLSPVRAAAIEQMHAERIVVHQASTETHRVQYQMAVEQREAAMQEWQARAQAIHGDLLAMVRLCLAVVDEEERRRIEEERRRAEAEQRRQEAEQKRLAEQQRRAQTQAVGKVREKQYLATRARYIQGLPTGKEEEHPQSEERQVISQLTPSKGSCHAQPHPLLVHYFAGAWESRVSDHTRDCVRM